MTMITQAEAEKEVDEPRSGRHYGALVPSAFCLVMALALPFFIFVNGPPRAMGPGPGPGSWPLAMIYALMGFSALWFIQDLCVALRGRGSFALAPLSEREVHYSMPMALSGLALITLYCVALPRIGFALSSATFIVIWCFYARLRSPMVVVPVAILGTISLLWIFMGLAMMPLPRGQGVFDGFSVSLLQLLRIY